MTVQTGTPAVHVPAAFWSPRRAVGRLLLAIVAGCVAAAAVPGRVGGPLRTVAGWDVAAAVLLVLVWRIILTAGPEVTARRAAAEDVGRTFAWAVVVLGSTVSIFAAAVALRNARTMAPRAEHELGLLCLLAVVTAWFLCHTTYTMRYAHLYYRDDGDLGGLGFPGTEMPCYLDFAYYAFTVGMCFQVSDITVTQSGMRRATLGHALLSFAFNTAVLALALNLLFGQLSPGS
ncbi:MAG TPA: DUF1345 domain-containing protein [Myxococcaceae bacterium]|nr:DUF1345 domain-containing protein [Myxococcaceae bacterium]